MNVRFLDTLSVGDSDVGDLTGCLDLLETFFGERWDESEELLVECNDFLDSFDGCLFLSLVMLGMRERMSLSNSKRQSLFKLRYLYVYCNGIVIQR